MSIVSPHGAPPASETIDDDAGSQWSLGSLISSAMVILVGIGVGLFISIFIGLLTGWIEIRC